MVATCSDKRILLQRRKSTRASCVVPVSPSQGNGKLQITTDSKATDSKMVKCGYKGKGVFMSIPVNCNDYSRWIMDTGWRKDEEGSETML